MQFGQACQLFRLKQQLIYPQSFIVASDRSFDIDRCLKIKLAVGLKVGKDMLPQ